MIAALILLQPGRRRWQPIVSILKGAFGSAAQPCRYLLIAWLPLLLTTAGVLITFSAGLWNIGMEGQITLGAIFTTWILRLLQDSSLPPGLIIFLGILAGILGGALWAGLAGALKTFGGVNEIFGGLGLEFCGHRPDHLPGLRPLEAPRGGFDVRHPALRKIALAADHQGHELESVGAGAGHPGHGAVYFLLRGTHFGLRLKAVGRISRPPILLGVPTWQYSMLAFLLCGAFAGLAGAIQVTAFITACCRISPAGMDSWACWWPCWSITRRSGLPRWPFLCRLEHRQHPVADPIQAGFLLLRRLAEPAGAVGAAGEGVRQRLLEETLGAAMDTNTFWSGWQGC